MNDALSKYGVPHRFVDYPEKVVRGEIVTGKLIRLACERYLSWFARTDIHFDCELAERPVNFAKRLKHSTGKFANKSFELLEWEKFLVYATYGWIRNDTNTRLTRTVYVQIARKNGKTSICAFLSLYALIADREAAAEVVFVAPSRDQSKIGYTDASNYAESINKGGILQCTRNEIRFPYTKSVLKTISSEAGFNDGRNIHTSIIDEFHAFKDTSIYDVIVSSEGFRTQPVNFIITTAGFDIFAPCKQFRDTYVDILNGLKTDDSVLALIYELDEDDDWQDASVWPKANPSIDVTVTSDYIRSQIQSAKNNTSLEVGVKTKTLNMWCQSSQIWVPDEYLVSAMHHFELEDLANASGSYQYIGVDLASVSDLTAVVSMIYNAQDDKYYFKPYVFLPEDTIQRSPNAPLYKQWKRNGWLMTTPGNVADFQYITNHIKKIDAIIPIQKICYDSWNAVQFTVECQELGMNMVPFGQSIGNFSPYTKLFERLLLSGKIVIDGNPIFRWCMQNVELKADWQDNVKPVKSGRQHNSKIDVVIASIMALGGYVFDHDNVADLTVV